MNIGLRIATAVALLLAGAISAPANAADGPYYIQATEVNLRAEPNGEIILVFDVNDKVFVVEQRGDWSFVSAPALDAKGWCWTDYIAAERTGIADAEAVCVPNDDAAVQVVKLQPLDTPSAASVPPEAWPAAKITQEAGDVIIEDAAVAGAAPVEVVGASNATGTSLSELDQATQSAARRPNIGKQEPVCEDPRAEDPLSVFSYNSENAAAKPPAAPDSSAGFIADDPAATPIQTPQATPVALPPATDWRPEGQAPTPEELAAPLYQPFEPTTRITTPGMLESAFYMPVGGHDLALIKGDNVNVRAGKSLKSDVLGRVGTGDKLYVIGHDDPWYNVSIPAKNLKGFVFGQYVDQLPNLEITGNQVRLREKPSLQGRIKAELNRGEVFFEFERKGNWILVASSASGLKGWVHKDYVAKTEKSASRPYKVSGDDVNFRASPNVDADIITALARDTEVSVHGRSQKWSFIEYGGQLGWMYSEYLAPVGRGLIVPQSALGQRLIARAKEMQGTPYVWGGESDSGVDCSGLIYKLLLEEGASANGLPRRASTQMAGLGQPVDKEDLAPGDLVFFTTYKSGASHVGIYLGDGDFIHASSAQGKVAISNMSEGYYKQRFVGARRISEAELRGK